MDVEEHRTEDLGKGLGLPAHPPVGRCVADYGVDILVGTDEIMHCDVDDVGTVLDVSLAVSGEECQDADPVPPFVESDVDEKRDQGDDEQGDGDGVVERYHHMCLPADEVTEPLSSEDGSDDDQCHEDLDHRTTPNKVASDVTMTIPPAM